MSEQKIPERKHKTWPLPQDELMTCGHHLCLASEEHIGSGIVCDLCAAEARCAEITRKLDEANAKVEELEKEMQNHARSRRMLQESNRKLRAALDERNNRGTGFLYIPKAWHEKKVAEQAAIIRELSKALSLALHVTGFDDPCLDYNLPAWVEPARSALAKLPMEAQSNG